LDETAKRLMMTHPDQGEQIYEHQTEINEMWNDLTAKVCTSNKSINIHIWTVFKTIVLMF